MKTYEKINRCLDDNRIESLIKSSGNIVEMSIEGEKMYTIWNYLFKIQPYFGYSLTNPDTEITVFEFFTN